MAKYDLDGLSDLEENRKEEDRGSMDKNKYVKKHWLYEIIKEMTHANSFVRYGQRLNLKDPTQSASLWIAKGLLKQTFHVLHMGFGDKVYKGFKK